LDRSITSFPTSLPSVARDGLAGPNAGRVSAPEFLRDFARHGFGRLSPCNGPRAAKTWRRARNGVTLPATLTSGVHAPQRQKGGVDLLHLPLCALTFLIQLPGLLRTSRPPVSQAGDDRRPVSCSCPNDARFQKRTSERSTAEIVEPSGAKTSWDDVAKCLQNMVARDGVEPPTPAFSGL